MITTKRIFSPILLEMKDVYEEAIQTERKITLQQMALIELERTSSNALSEILEEMGMIIAGKEIRRQNPALKEKKEGKQYSLINFAKSSNEVNVNSSRMISLEPQNGKLLEIAKQIVNLSEKLMKDTLDEDRKKKLNARLAMLIEEYGWEIALLAMPKSEKTDPILLRPIMRLIQQILLDEPEVSLLDWFNRISGWHDRNYQLRVLLRVISFELSSCLLGQQQRRLAVVLQRLRRLLLFLGLENECRRIEELCSLKKGILLPLTIEIVSEHWLFTDWLNNKLEILELRGSLRNRLLYHLIMFFIILPDDYFVDCEQREQIIDIMRQLLLK